MTYTIIEAHSAEDFGHKAAAAFIRAVSQAPQDPQIILPTGTTPLPLYAALREARRRPSFSYRQLDEYLGLGDHDKRLFSAWLEREILSPLGISRRMTFNSAANPDHEVHRILDWYATHGPADIAVLGMGNNGHVGFNEPGSGFEERVRVVDLMPETIAANQDYWPDGTVPTQAITLGIADLKEAEQTILIVRGEAKAEMLYQALYGPVTKDVPASYLQHQPNLTIVADQAALSRMPR